MNSQTSQSSDSPHALSTKTVALHWVVAAFIIVNLILGIYIDRTETFSLMGIHKSIGVLAVVFVIWRFVWRMRAGWLDDSIGQSKAWELIVSRMAHWVLLVCSVVAPISGIVGSIASGRGLPFFTINLIAPNIDEWGSGERVPLNEVLAGVAMGVHKFTVILLALCLLLHIAGALKHALIYRDGIAGRIFGRKIG